MLLTLLVEDVRIDLLAQPSGVDADQLGDHPARERGVAGPQEVFGRLAVQNQVSERRPGQPLVLALAHDLGEPKVIVVACQLSAIKVDISELQVGDDGHRVTVSASAVHGGASSGGAPAFAASRPSTSASAVISAAEIPRRTWRSNDIAISRSRPNISSPAGVSSTTWMRRLASARRREIRPA